MSGVIGDYERVLRQRNTLLKSARASGVKPDQLGTLDIWDERLVALGSELILARANLTAELRPEVTRAYETIAGADHAATIDGRLSIRSTDPDSDSDTDATATLHDVPTFDEISAEFSRALARLRRAELDRGVSLVGPHRDDLLLGLNGMPARGYASHGESWSFALALKLASAEVLRRESSTGDPVLILDDVFAELDESRRDRLGAAVSSFEQVLITAAVFDDVPAELASHVVRIKAGAVVE